MNSLSNEQIKNIIQKILNHFADNIKDKMKYLTNYVMDLSLISSNSENNKPYFIEPGPFGKDYAIKRSFKWIITVSLDT